MRGLKMRISVILLQVNPQRPRRLPLKGDAPGSVDVNAVPGRLGTQRMQLVTGEIQTLPGACSIEEFQAVAASLHQIRPDPGGSAGFEQLLEALVPEAFDHARHLVISGPYRRTPRNIQVTYGAP